MPPNTRVDDARASVFNMLGQRHDLLPDVRRGSRAEARYYINNNNRGVATVEAVWSPGDTAWGYAIELYPRFAYKWARWPGGSALDLSLIHI